jgi:ABC-type multidrug transport system fused ATPase/permease subunit
MPSIDSSSEDGLKLKELNGNIEFENVSFNYPSRPDINILKKTNFKIKSGSTVALVGHSGCGIFDLIKLQ